MESIADRKIALEISFKASRSSGPGGQHANKVSTRVQASFDLAGSHLLSAFEKERLLNRLKSRLDKDGVLHVSESSSRSQSTNKERAIKKIIGLLTQGLKTKKRRIPTKISAEKKRARLKSKRQRSALKKSRAAVKRDDFS